MPPQLDVHRAALDAGRARRARLHSDQQLADPSVPLAHRRCPVCRNARFLVQGDRPYLWVCENPPCIYARAKARAEALRATLPPVPPIEAHEPEPVEPPVPAAIVVKRYDMNGRMVQPSPALIGRWNTEVAVRRREGALQ